MLFSYNWLKEYLEGLPQAEEVSERLTMSGTEIESVSKTGAAFTNVVTAQVVTCDKHPNADKLSLCQVRTDREELQIVCGAKNMKPGDKVALAMIGAELPGGFKIKKSKIRGVESQGMMCSEVELGLKDTSNGIMILPPETPLGVDYGTILGSDYMMVAGITPNRADLLSIRGIAREASAVTGARFTEKSFPVAENGRPIGETASVSIDTGAPCGRYSARVIEGVKIAQSPDDMKNRLEAHGIRPINNVVDVTNLVLLELGQPLHAFDLDKLSGRKIIVRLAKEGERMETIDAKERALDASMLVIADNAAPVAVAGVMGGKGSEVSETTVNILLESAWFEPSAVRSASRKLGLSTDSSYRFERGVDIEGTVRALDMAANLIAKLAGGTVAKGVIDIYPSRSAPAPIDFRLKRAHEILGVEIEEKEVLGIFGRLGISAKVKSASTIEATPPTSRMDLATEIDLIEEAARIFGYNNIPAKLPVAKLAPGDPGELALLRKKIKGALAASGLVEVMNYSFVSKDAFALGSPQKDGVAIMNPLTEEQVIMRGSLLPSLLDNLKYNLARKNEDVRIFEIAPVFAAGEKLPEERQMIAGLIYGARYESGWSFPRDTVDFFDAKGIVERLFESIGIEKAIFEKGQRHLMHPGKTAVVKIAGKPAGTIGELHPELWDRYDIRKPAYIFELELGAILKAASAVKRYSQLPRFPESERDIAFISGEETPFRDISDSIKRIDAKHIEKVELFDVYYGSNIPSGKRSLAVRVTYRSREGTLTYQEVEDMHSRVVSELKDRFQAEIRE
ncbi:MAG: phenylalanine--tRNA ligase subunit beta [Deltaproteobacteria bacterium GWA2_55_10]|nr:MAG: phenylalanine--tRNA ligase subunit beta [Deltaproteobacteria bacterium GWA2_55_10]